MRVAQTRRKLEHSNAHSEVARDENDVQMESHPRDSELNGVRVVHHLINTHHII